MQSSSGATAESVQPQPDIIFQCSHCTTSFVVEATAAGVTLACQNCGKQTTVPQPRAQIATDRATEIANLQRQLKENDSQRTEITGYINQLSIQLHRWQLRLQTLKERQTKLKTELAALGTSESDSIAAVL